MSRDCVALVSRFISVPITRVDGFTRKSLLVIFERGKILDFKIAPLPQKANNFNSLEYSISKMGENCQDRRGRCHGNSSGLSARLWGQRAKSFIFNFII
jgi:hypothetical protein